MSIPLLSSGLGSSCEIQTDSHSTKELNRLPVPSQPPYVNASHFLVCVL